MRRGIWSRVLSRLERAQVDLTLRLVRRVRSPFLAQVLNMIMEKLQSALESRVSRMISLVGFPTARRLSMIAQSWGNRSAVKWADDQKFARFLTVKALSDPSLWSSHQPA